MLKAQNRRLGNDLPRFPIWVKQAGVRFGHVGPLCLLRFGGVERSCTRSRGGTWGRPA